MKKEIKRVVKNEKFKTWFIYTMIFTILVLFLLFIYKSLDKSLILNSDALTQHYVILKNFNELIRNFLQNPSRGLLGISFSIGLGADLIGQYSYYVLGDPFSYISLLFPMKHLEGAYTFLIFLRMYFVGISFIIFGNYKKLKQKNILVGSLIYTFSGFCLYAGVRHPYFLNPVIIFPLLLISVDILFKKNKIIPLITLTTIAILSNYYFFYMLTVLIGLYILMKFFFEYKEKGYKFFIKIALKVILSYLVAFLISSVIFLPTLYAFANSSRIDVNNFTYYGLGYYYKLYSGLVTTEYYNWNIYGVSSIIILMIPMFLKNIKKQKVLTSYLITMIIILLIPHLGSFMNGLSYPTNRWIFALSFLLSYVVALHLDFDFKYTKKDIINMFIFLFLYTLGIIITRISLNKAMISVLILAFLMLLTIIFNKNLRKIKINPSNLIILLITLNLASLIYFTYSTKGNMKYALKFVNKDEVNLKYETLDKNAKNYKHAIKAIKKDNDAYRISNTETSLPNISLYYNTMGMNSFFSIGSKYEATLAKELNNFGYEISKYIKEFDNRTRISTLLGTKYYIAGKVNNSFIPYGYTLYKELDDTKIYKNNHNLNLGLFYNSYITNDEYEKLSSLNKEESLMQNVTLDEIPKDLNLKHNSNISNEEKVNFKLEGNITNNKIAINKNKKTIKIKILDNLKETDEIYLSIKDLQYDEFLKNNIKNQGLKKYLIKKIKNSSNNEYKLEIEKENFKKWKKYRAKNSSAYYLDSKDILINLGSKNNNNEITLKLSDKGTYSFSNIEVLKVSLDNYSNQINKFKNNEFRIQEFKNNKIVGSINNKTDGILQITTPYSKGWKAKVNKKEVKILNVNKSFIGVPLKQGNNQVEFIYETPYLKLGIVLSTIGIISYIIIYRKEKN